MKTAECKTHIIDHYETEFGKDKSEFKAIKRVRKVKDDRGRTVRSFTLDILNSFQQDEAIVVTDATDSKVLDIIVLADSEIVDDNEALKDSLYAWDWERIGGRPQDYDNAMPPSAFYFCFCPPYEPGDEPFVVVTRKDVWDADGYVDDSEVSDIVTEPYGLSRMMESVYEYPTPKAKTRATLLAAGFIENNAIKDVVGSMG
ncbi:hypothetical protein N9917_01560 [Deltaproteobacteria bacterium]|nr:hypothetical protein [Deltaproteobacteria bacterium]